MSVHTYAWSWGDGSPTHTHIYTYIYIHIPDTRLHSFIRCPWSFRCGRATRCTAGSCRAGPAMGRARCVCLLACLLTWMDGCGVFMDGQSTVCLLACLPGWVVCLWMDASPQHPPTPTPARRPVVPPASHQPQNPPLPTLTPPPPAQHQVKRLRLCVADNEAMRAAFSLLRVREAEEGELVRMLGGCVRGLGFLRLCSKKDV